jgi:hypothetical protein
VLPPWQPRAVEVRGEATTLEIGGKDIMGAVVAAVVHHRR